MTAPLTLPFWLFILLIVFAVIGIVDRIFAPGVRWFFRRRVNSAIEELNSRLDTQIQPFKLTRKQTLVDQLMYDAHVIEAAEIHAKETGTPLPVVMQKAERYAREIVPSFSPLAYFGIGTRLSRLVSMFVYRVRLGYLNDDNLRKISPEASIVFVMNHRSNMDYVLVTYLASARTTLSYAVGEWARIWGLQGLIKAMGAYFIRRTKSNDLYRKVLARYVSMATREGVPQAVFPEGGLTRDGALREPKLGLISYMLADFKPDTSKDIVFVPVGINYDRVIEDRILTRKLEEESTGRDFSDSISKTLMFIASLLSRRVRGKLYRYGYACVSFGNPISLSDWLKTNKLDITSQSEKTRFKLTDKLGEHLLSEVGKVVPALPVSLVASVFTHAKPDRLTRLELHFEFFSLAERLAKNGAYVHIAREDTEYALETGLRMLTMRNIILEDEEGNLSVNPDERVLLTYYSNSIVHLL